MVMFPDGENVDTVLPFISPYSQTVFTLSAYHAVSGTSENPVYSVCFLKFDRPELAACSGIASDSKRTTVRNRLTIRFGFFLSLLLF